ncbi:MAG: Calx-beta domain-containing protein [Nitrosopumilaceae archaeon]
MSFSKIVVIPLFSVFIFMMVMTLVPATAEPCDCVIFRFVDIQDFWLNTVRVDVMDTFISEDEKVTLSVILNSTGGDQTIINKVDEGVQSGHFELTLHGFNHENFSTFNFTEQKNLMELSQAKMQSLWGVNSTSFVPPMHQWNNNTLQVMKDLNIPIISAGPQGIDPPENIKFIANPPSNITDSFGNYHLPQTSEFYDHGTIPHTKIPHGDIMAAVDAAIATYGYSVLNLYGTDFSERDGNGDFTGVTNSTEINDLLKIFNATRARGYTITTFEDITIGSLTPNPTVSINNVTLPEGNSGANNFVFNVTRSNNLSDISVQYQTTDDSATSPSDYTSISLSILNFTNGGSFSKIIPVSVNGDKTVEQDEVFFIDLLNCIGCTLEDDQGIGTITNDDNACVIPDSGEWSITEDCTLLTSSTAPANVVIQGNSTLKIPSGVSLDIDFFQFNLTVEIGSRALIESGGLIT